jgi:hypothetical protein
MLIELLKPRRNNAPVTLPDGSIVQFNEDVRGKLVADIANDQALIILRHKNLYARVESATKIEEPATEAEEPKSPITVTRKVKKVG